MYSDSENENEPLDKDNNKVNLTPSTSDNIEMNIKDKTSTLKNLNRDISSSEIDSLTNLNTRVSQTATPRRQAELINERQAELPSERKGILRTNRILRPTIQAEQPNRHDIPRTPAKVRSPNKNKPAASAVVNQQSNQSNQNITHQPTNPDLSLVENPITTEARKEKEREEIKQSWSDDKEEIINCWVQELGYNQIIIYFNLFQLKKTENFWAWLIIVLSAIVSTISLIQFDKDEDDADLVLAINVCVTILTTFITLIASWMKKQNYVGKISESEKYLQSLTSLMAELEGQIKISKEDRMKYSIFLEKYKDKVVQFNSSMPLISPEDWKRTNYTVTKYYPELITDSYPWTSKEDFEKQILVTYHNVKYRTWFRRLLSDYYCSSSCCKKEEENVLELKKILREKKRLKNSNDLIQLKLQNALLKGDISFPKNKVKEEIIDHNSFV